MGLDRAPLAALVGAASVVILVVRHLAHPAWPSWTIYYMETAPVPDRNAYLVDEAHVSINVYRPARTIAVR